MIDGVKIKELKAHQDIPDTPDSNTQAGFLMEVLRDDDNLLKLGFKLVGGFGGYFLLTRGIRPFFDQSLNWDSLFNRLAKKISLPVNYSRLKVWQYEA